MKEFEQFTDPEHMRGAFERLLPGYAPGSLEINRCTLLHARYKTWLRESRATKLFLKPRTGSKPRTPSPGTGPNRFFMPERI
jgi:hypothetical protein